MPWSWMSHKKICYVLVFVFIGAMSSPITNDIMGSIQDSSNDSNKRACLIPDIFHGMYKRQNDNLPPDFFEGGIRGPVHYLEMFIGPTSIPLWGDCVSKTKNAFVLGQKKIAGYTCYRCFLLLQRTHNVLQIVTQSEDLCYRNPEAAEKSCRNSKYINPGEGIILWRSSEIRHSYCPLGGRAKLSYVQSSGMNCPYPASVPSTISNCYLGYQLDLHFRSCSGPNYDMSLQCLGSWDSGHPNGESYFAVFNTDAQEFRCGIFRDERATKGIVLAALSNDSTCDHSLLNSTSGHEIFVFHEEPSPSWPQLSSKCEFPLWLQGDWGVVTVNKEQVSYYHRHDPSTMATVHAKCVEFDESHGKIRVFSRSQCGDPIGFHCMWIERRSASVIEFKMGNLVVEEDDPTLCYDQHTFTNASWITLSVRQPAGVTEFYHVGSYSTPTTLQELGGVCVNVTVDCDTKYRMDTLTYKCGTEHIIQANQYQCLAKWKEGQVSYSYVRRMQDDTRGCLVSQHMNGQLYMVWTVNECQRDMLIDEHMLYNTDIDKTLFILQQDQYCQDITTPEIVDPSFPTPSLANRFISSVLLILCLCLMSCCRLQFDLTTN